MTNQEKSHISSFFASSSPICPTVSVLQLLFYRFCSTDAAATVKTLFLDSSDIDCFRNRYSNAISAFAYQIFEIINFLSFRRDQGDSQDVVRVCMRLKTIHKTVKQLRPSTEAASSSCFFAEIATKKRSAAAAKPANLQ